VRLGACALALLVLLVGGTLAAAEEDLLAPARARLEDAAFEDALSATDAVLARESLTPWRCASMRARSAPRRWWHWGT
jgi:hypothetical protein